MKRFAKIYIPILVIVLSGFVNRSVAQQLASEKPVSSFISKTTKQQLGSKAAARQPVASTTRQELPSEKAMQQPAVPRAIKAKRTTRKSARPSTAGHTQLASEKPMDKEKVNRLRNKK